MVIVDPTPKVVLLKFMSAPDVLTVPRQISVLSLFRPLNRAAVPATVALAEGVPVRTAAPAEALPKAVADRGMVTKGVVNVVSPAVVICKSPDASVDPTSTRSTIALTAAF